MGTCRVAVVSSHKGPRGRGATDRVTGSHRCVCCGGMVGWGIDFISTVVVSRNDGTVMHICHGMVVAVRSDASSRCDRNNQ